MSNGLLFALWQKFKNAMVLPSMPTLQNQAAKYEEELCDRVFTYTFQEGTKKPFKVRVEFERSGFCHLFSLGSIVKNVTPDLDQFSGMKGWNNIKSGAVDYPMLRRLDPDQFAYYHKEHLMLDQMIETAWHPQAVLFDRSRVPGSKLESDILLYSIYNGRCIHIGLSQNKNDGTWFVRSYFVREVSQDKQFPTKYIANMPQLKAKVKVSSKNA